MKAEMVRYWIKRVEQAAMPFRTKIWIGEQGFLVIPVLCNPNTWPASGWDPDLGEACRKFMSRLAELRAERVESENSERDGQ